MRLEDLVRNYRKIFSIILTLFISLFILSTILTIEDSLKKELDDNAKSLLGGDVEIDYNRVQGNLKLIDKVRKFTTISVMVEFTTMVSSVNNNNQSLFTRIKTVDKNIRYMEKLFMSLLGQWIEFIKKKIPLSLMKIFLKL